MKHLLTIGLTLLAFNLSAQDVAPEDLINQGNASYQAKDYKAAFEAYSKALPLYEAKGAPDKNVYYSTFYNAAASAQKANMDDEAIPYYEKAIEYGYKEAVPYRKLADIYNGKKDLTKMESVLKEGLEKYPDNSSLKKALSICLTKQASAFYKKGAKIKSDANASGLSQTDADAYNAEIEKSDAEFKKALPIIEKAYQYDSKNKNALKILSNIYTALEREDDAAKIKAELDALQK